jgi:zinc transport system substrate-binding protein
MKKTILILLMAAVASCGGTGKQSDKKIISVSIGPFKYFVKGIADTIFDVNVMVPPGSNPHNYEPYPEQIRQLSRSAAYISDGYLGFEMTWLDRFFGVNKNMKKLSLSGSIDPIAADHHESGGHAEAADPHYWVSPACAFRIALSVRDFLTTIDPDHRELFEKNYENLRRQIAVADSLARGLSAAHGNREFMIYHPNLAYLARDYGLKEITVEYEGKEPSPARMKDLIDIARKENLKTILVQKEYDTKNPKAIADETGARIVIIDPLSEDWFASVTGIIGALKAGFEEGSK